ncbi:hypothetical protein A5735_05020 [Mycolicibacter heraklionensis]|nr:hypothetical protein A5735_05020 [Mycolicibacter heraklionensis]
MDTTCDSGPLSKSDLQWRSELGGLKSQGLGEDDPQVRDCRAALAYWRVRKVIDEVAGKLSPAGVDALTAQLLGVAR